MITANRSRSLALGNWWRGQPTATAQGRGRSAEVPAPGFEPSGWAANPRDPHPHPGRAAQRAEGCLQGASPVDSVFSATRLCPAAAPRCALGRASALLGPYCRTGEGGAAPPLNDPASPAPTPPETSVCLVPPDLRFLTPRPATRRLRAAYAAPRWRAASTGPVRLAGSRNFPSAPRSVPRLTREAGGETPRATNRRASSGPVRMRGEKGTSGCALPAQPRSDSPAQEAGGSVPGKLVGGNETF